MKRDRTASADFSVNAQIMQRTVLFWTLSLATLTGGAWLICLQGQCVVPDFDLGGLGLAHALRSDMLDGWMAGISWLGSLILLLPLAALVALALWRRGCQLEAGFLMLALLGASAFSHLAKLLIMRPRPDLFPAWSDMPADWSYPSAHAMQITAMAMAIALIAYRRHALHGALLAAAVLLVVLLVGLSRIYLQVHFPSDVLAGTLAAAFWALGLHALMFGKYSGHDGLTINGVRT